MEVINAQDAVLLGRVTYQEWAAFWPTATDELAFARFINPVPKYVVSTTLSNCRGHGSPQPYSREIFPRRSRSCSSNLGRTLACMEVSPSCAPCSNGICWMSSSWAFFPSCWVGEGVCSTKEIASNRLQLVSSKSTRTGGLLLTYQLARP